MLAPLTALSALLLAAPPEAPPARPASPADSFRPDPAWKPQGPALWFDPKARRLIMRARVVLREGPLEHLLCLKGTKEHEAILATEAEPRLIQFGLNLTGAREGYPVRFLPKFEPPAGSTIAIDLEWEEAGQARRADARAWIKDEKSGAPLKIDWVFAGSTIFEDPQTKRRIYTADEGDLITVVNFASAILDLPFASSANDADRVFSANTARIPPLGTPVTLYLRPRDPGAAKEPSKK